MAKKKMSDGERLVWAATWALEFKEQMSRPKPRIGLVWYWHAAHQRRGCSLVGIKPRLSCKCSVCQTVIEAGHYCWRGDGGVMGLREMDDWRNLRVCAECVEKLPREPFKDSAPAPASTGGRKLAPLRLLKVEP